MAFHHNAPCHLRALATELPDAGDRSKVRLGYRAAERDRSIMLKTLTGGVMALALMAGTASSQDVEFRSGAFVTFSGCAGLSGTDYMNFRYRPFVSGQQQGTQLSGFFPFFGFNVSSTIDINSVFTIVNGNTVAGVHVDWPNNSQLKLTNKSPLIIQSTTNRVDLAGEFKNVQIANCSATFRAGLERMP